MKEELSAGLAKLNIRDVEMLVQKIQRTETQIKFFEEDNRTDDAEREKALLRELQRLQSLADQIAKLEQESVKSENSVEKQVRQMKEELSTGMANFGIRDVEMLPQRLQRTETQIKFFEEDNRTDDAEREKALLRELQRLQSLADQIATLEQESAKSENSVEKKVRQMKEELSAGLAKLNIRDVEMLVQKIQRTETQIKFFEEDNRTDDAEREKALLRELQRLQSLADQIATLEQESAKSENSGEKKVRQMKEELSTGMANFGIRDVEMLVQKIQRTETQIKFFEEDNRTDDAEREKAFLRELQRLQTLADEIARLQSVPSSYFPPMDESTTPERDANNTITLDDARKKRLYIYDLDAEIKIMPPCAIKTLFKLLVHFETKLLEENTVSTNQETMMLSLQTLKDQMKREELRSDDVKAILHNLEMHLNNDEDSLTVFYLNELLKKFRSLNVAEIQRLVDKAREAGDSIQNKDVVLLIGTTGSGKSTTIQFLAGATMKEVKVEVGPGNFLEHVTAVGTTANLDLRNVISSPLQKSETRYIVPVSIQLEDILGADEIGVLTLCDAPGFGDTAGPEVDIANSIGVIEALAKTNSVKILALISYKSLGDRGQGVQKLAHILINMIHGIKDKLDAIVYAFTKFPASTCVHALLLDIKKSKVDEDATLRSDIAFVSVLKDMIKKTKNGATKIEPTKDDPMELIEKLNNTCGIRYPGEVFRFSMGEETRAALSDHAQRDKFSIICAMKYKDYELINYYLNDLQILRDLLKEIFIRDVYDESVRFVSESINNYSIEMKEKFNRVLASQDGLQNKDILDYRRAINYLENAQVLKEHLQSTLVAPASMVQNIINQLNERSQSLAEEELRSPLVIIYLKNLSELKNSFVELRESYHSTCKMFQTRFDELIETARKLIPTHDFKQIADVLFNVYQSACVLQNHIDGQVQETYGDVVKYLLRNLNRNSEEAEPVLAKMRLSQEDIEKVKSSVEILRSAKNTATLQERVSHYLEIMKKKAENVETYDSFGQNIKDVNGIYDEFISKILKHFEEINIRIKELFEKSGDHALENIKVLVADMDALRTISEIELRTAAIYYHTVEKIREYTEELRAGAEKLIIAFDQQTGMMNFRYLARSLASLKNAEWINQVSPGTYDNLMKRITEELSQYTDQLQTSLIKLDLSLKCPENIVTAAEIVEKIKSMRDLEHSVPELQKYRNNIVERFQQSTQAVFHRIQNTFNLDDRDVNQIRQKLKELEESKRQYQDLHPARVLLRKQGYADIETLNSDIEKTMVELKAVQQYEEAAKSERDTEINTLNAIMAEHVSKTFARSGVVNTFGNAIGTRHSDRTDQPTACLQQFGYDSIELVYDKITKIKRAYSFDTQRFQNQINELRGSLDYLESMKKEHDAMLASRQSSSEEVTFLREKGFGSFELLDKAIQEKTKEINQKGKNKQAYHFADRLEVATADNAIVYIIQCEKVGHDHVRENAIDVHEKLLKYIREYGIFLDQTIDEKFADARNVDSEGGPFTYSQDLEIRLQELSSFSRYPHVLGVINGVENIEKWHHEFLAFHRSLSANMEQYKVACKLRELRDQLIVAQALTCVDRFCSSVFANNGFAALYRQYQGEITRECRAAYKTVLDYILNRDYANADMAISDIEDNSLNLRDEAQIKNDLLCSLNKLIRDTKSVAFWLEGKIEREDNRAQVIQIRENIDKIRIACSKCNIMNRLDESTRTNLHAFDNEISTILAGIILRGLDSIEAFIKADSFSEAQKGMENLSQVQRELAGYCISDDVMRRGEVLRKKLDGIVDEVLKRNEFSDINQFSVNPPKDLLNRLKEVGGHGSAKFTQAYTSMLEKTRKTFNVALEAARKAHLDVRSGQIRSLNYALNFLPEELQQQYKLQIDELNIYITNEEEKWKDDLEKLFLSVDDNEHVIEEIGSLAELYTTQKMHDLLRTLREKCVKKLQTHRINAQKLLEERNIQSAIDIVRIILKYEEYVGHYNSEIKGIIESVRAFVIKKFCSCYETFHNLSSVDLLLLEKDFADVLTFLEYLNSFKKGGQPFFPDEIMQKAGEAFHRLSQYFIENSKHFQAALRDINLLEIDKTTSISKKWQPFLEKTNHCSSNHTLVHKLLENMKGIISYKNMLLELGRLIDGLKRQLSVEFVSRETHQYEIKREKLFQNLVDIFNKLQSMNSKLKDILPSPIDIEAVEKDIKAKVEKMRSQLIDRASKPELTPVDADEFRMYYNHLVSFNKHFHFPNINVDQILTEAETKILAKVGLWKQTVYKSTSDPIVVSSVLAKIKFLAENLSMFDTLINRIIDEILKHYKQKEKSFGIMSLSLELQKTDVGARLISEHAVLSGEDLRLRRQKMQYQDNLDYGLDNLTGTDLAKEVLRSRYKTFRQKYDELLAINLKLIKPSDDKEPNLEALVAQTKTFVSTVTVKADSITWTRTFRENLPELLAHIFTIWTLKNTQHYNVMRGIDQSNAYLLMPHIGQIIAIFRLLSLGYEKHKEILGFKIPFTGKTSEDSVNNLAEVGTGEGKSVVMAITACVFALTGIDVNCSCYSDILSTRDKNDFASVFRALGIEDRIQYGTFNKLCEQLLNEQCNVREKVRDMILTNKSTLPKIDTSKRIRPKVLLIDEVDVFLSDKYYGGMYMPSVFLKDDAIKALLDSIWQNKHFKSLESIQALPAYKACATKFSNWMMLFDEAIKDMIAALQSYQSSTYLVQNDKIVYVDGESIVDNVVLGYDTVWAYYHENSKENICSTSLQENIGILINCGRFSYAEMPLDFAWIGGVTGTLKTLAPIEINILENVYAITKTTFIPSVFGSSNRTYNEQNDVRVVNESEYYMEICNEIRIMCDTQRAILIFFKSEEQLEAFYKSSQLAQMKQTVQIITEKVSVKDRELYIKRAATVGVVTLLTRTFGRGTDFICRQQQLLATGGIHVLQTFFSEELSEEYQIMGRGARQGDRGSYRMILLDKDLEWILGSSWRESIRKIQGTALYQNLHEKRRAIYESKCGAKELGIKQCKSDHEYSKKFMSALTSAGVRAVKKFLMKQNKGTNPVIVSSRTVLLMDATGSMASLLSAAKDTVCTMFERASHVLSQKGLPNDAFQMQFVVYRDYDCREDGLLQSSAWESKPDNLRNFMTKVTATGGGDYEEAIEIGLWHVVQQSESPEEISQVILIGDAPAKEMPAIIRDRQATGGETYWGKTKYKVPTYYVTEMQQLKVRNIPVHTFYLADGAKSNFEMIASQTSGQSKYLDINSARGAELLTDFVTEAVLKKTAGDQADAVVALYRRLYVSYTS